LGSLVKLHYVYVGVQSVLMTHEFYGEFGSIGHVVLFKFPLHIPMELKNNSNDFI